MEQDGQPLRQAQVFEELSRLQSITNYLQERLENLESRLHCVTLQPQCQTPAPPQVAKEDEPYKLVELASLIRDMANQIDDIATEMQFLYNRIEL